MILICANSDSIYSISLYLFSYFLWAHILIVLYRLRSLPQLSHTFFFYPLRTVQNFYIADVPILSLYDVTVI